MASANLAPFDRTGGTPVDVCLLVEGCYPHVAGGVSTWVDWLIRALPDKRFAVVSIVAPGEDRRARYVFPDNLLSFQEIELGGGKGAKRRGRKGASPSPERLSSALSRFLLGGKLDDLSEVYRQIRAMRLEDLLGGRQSFDLVCGTYRELMPHGIFEDFYWAWHSLVGGLFCVLKADLPEARVYHAVSTGYAGLLLARARLETQSRTVITEHGIYTNERRIELLLADWLVDAVDNGYGLVRNRLDIRDLWIRAFESYARACYAGADAITTLFADNQPMQSDLGAARDKLRVIPNGIDFERFAAIPPVPATAPLTVALIGRVVPIKDVKTFVAAVARLADRVPGVKALVAGPLDEDETYAAECRALAANLGLEEVLTFTGRVEVTRLLADVHVVVLTSLSEAQPLTVLEAGAAGRPCVTTNVGACREMLEGARDENPPLGAGGIVTDILAVNEIAAAMEALLTDPARRHAAGEALRERVRLNYTTAIAQGRYRDLYSLTPPTLTPPHREARPWPASVSS